MHSPGGGGVLAIAQEQDEIGGGYDPNQAFSGKISDFGVWNRALSQSEVSRLAKCEIVDDQTRLVKWTWPFNRSWIVRGVEIQEVQKYIKSRSLKMLDFLGCQQ